MIVILRCKLYNMYSALIYSNAAAIFANNREVINTSECLSYTFVKVRNIINDLNAMPTCTTYRIFEVKTNRGEFFEIQ